MIDISLCNQNLRCNIYLSFDISYNSNTSKYNCKANKFEALIDPIYRVLSS